MQIQTFSLVTLNFLLSGDNVPDKTYTVSGLTDCTNGSCCVPICCQRDVETANITDMSIIQCRDNTGP